MYVNLYIPSALRWVQDGAEVVLTQRSQYPFESVVQFELKTSHARDFTLSFRIPAWATGASVSVNGRRVLAAAAPGSFVAIHRQWRSGDRIEVETPMTMRLEAVDPRYPQTVALVFGPIVLFAITDAQPVLTRAQLPGAKRIDQRSWQVRTDGAPIKMLPFTDIAEEQYSTYVRVT